MTWVLMATGRIDGPWWIRALGNLLRSRFLAAFLAAIDRPAATSYLPAIGARRIADRNVTADEADRVRALLRRVSPEPE